jgi:hypothetical protein
MIVFDINVNITDFLESLVQISKGLPTLRMQSVENTIFLIVYENIDTIVYKK